MARALVCLMAAFCVATAHAQTARVSGRPLVLIAQSGRADTVAGFINGFGRAQLVGDSVMFATRDFAGVSGVFAGRGGNASVVRVAGPGSGGSGGTLQVFHDGFVTGTAETAAVLAAGASGAGGLYRTGADPLVEVVAPGFIAPNSGGLVLNVLGEPNVVDGRIAVIGAHQPAAGGESFRGVYRVVDGSLVPVADTATALPDGFGIPDGFSSQVGWDGGTLAFWASRGPFTENEGMFVWTAAGGVRRIAGNGDPIPGGGTIDGLISPPVVDDGAVYFYAYEAGGKTHLLRHRDGTLTRLAGDGDLTPEGTPLMETGHIGLTVEDGVVWFPDVGAGGAALYAIENGQMRTVIPPGTRILGIRADTFVMQDVAGDTVVFLAVSGANQYLFANLAAPAPPVIVEEPVDVSAAPGSTVELTVSVLGEEPLRYYWQRGATVFGEVNGPVLTLPAVSAADIGYYQVRISNAVGQAFSRSALVNVEVAPEFLSQLPPRTVETGDQLVLSPVVTGGLPITFRWTRDGEPATSSSGGGVFVRNGTTLADSGIYRVTASNAWGQVTSDPIPVTVLPPPPNPAFAGRRLASVLDADTVLPGTGMPMDTSGLSEYSARWVGDEILFIARTAGLTPAGLMAWSAGTVRAVLPVGFELPGGLGSAVDYGFPQESVSADPLLITGSRPGQFGASPVGVYRVTDGTLETVFDLGMDAPGTPGQKVDNLFVVSQGGGRVVFTAKAGGVPGLYLAGGGDPVRLLSGADNLPVVGTDLLQFQSLDVEGDTYLTVAASTGLQKQVALLGTVGGPVTPILARDEPIPGTALTVRTFGPASLRDGQAYLNVYDPGFAQHLLVGDAGGLTRVAGPGMTVNGLGTIQAIESSFLRPSGGRVFFAARVTVPTGQIRAVLSAGPDGIEPVVSATKLEGQRVGFYSVLAADPDRLLLLVTFESGARALYANVGESDDAVPTLGFGREPGGPLRLTVPAGTVLEGAPTPFGGWEPVPGTGSVDVDPGAGERYFRLRRE